MLEKIKSPNDIRGCTYEQLDTLCVELRKKIIDTVIENGGHLASNLGIVEATVAIHRVFNTPQDKIVFDVGHQCYAHKLLTGRYEQFATIRQFNGLSGFISRDESEYDSAFSGHCGTSVSMALGMAVVNKIENNNNYIVALVGDGAFTNGMIYEALNNCAKKDLNLIILLNDNEMSISSNVGGISKYFSSMRNSERYFNFKRRLQNNLIKIPYVGDFLIQFFRTIRNLLKRLLLKSNLFEDLGLCYLGPVDGNNIEKLEIILNEAKKKHLCCIVHMRTKKGKGYLPSEERPDKYHGVKPASEITSEKETFSSVFGQIICKNSENNNKICAVTAAMCDGTGLSEFSRKCPERFFDVGIAEEHAVTFSAGMALSGMKPVCALYSTFAQRVYDQILHDVSLQNISVIFAFDRSGLVPNDGKTHQGIFDISFMSAIPNMQIYSPETYAEMNEAFNIAFMSTNPILIRYPKGSERKYDRSEFIEEDFLTYTKKEADMTVITYGRITEKVLKAAKNKDIRIIKLKKIFPIDYKKIDLLTSKSKKIIVVEESFKSGGIGEKLAANLKISVNIKAIEDFVPHGDLESLYSYCGFQPEDLQSYFEDSMK